MLERGETGEGGSSVERKKNFYVWPRKRDAYIARIKIADAQQGEGRKILVGCLTR